jgi:ribonuclease D
MRAIPGFSGRMRSGDVPRYFEALTKARQLKDAELPKPGAAPSDGPPPVRAWADKDPAAAVRLTAAREAMAGLAAQYTLPVENLLAPDSLRRLCWNPPATAPSDEQVATFLAAAGARPWQVQLATPTIAEVLREVAARASGAGE